MKTLHWYKFALRRADGRETFASSHQPETRWSPMPPAQLRRIRDAILAMPHWRQFLGGQAGTVIARHHSTTKMLGDSTADARDLMASTPEEIVIT